MPPHTQCLLFPIVGLSTQETTKPGEKRTQCGWWVTDDLAEGGELTYITLTR